MESNGVGMILVLTLDGESFVGVSPKLLIDSSWYYQVRDAQFLDAIRRGE